MGECGVIGQGQYVIVWGGGGGMGADPLDFSYCCFYVVGGSVGLLFGGPETISVLLVPYGDASSQWVAAG